MLQGVAFEFQKNQRYSNPPFHLVLLSRGKNERSGGFEGSV
jgi:hypothetical protein